MGRQGSGEGGHTARSSCGAEVCLGDGGKDSKPGMEAEREEKGQKKVNTFFSSGLDFAHLLQ